jgi:hypothetical protein
VTIYLAKDSNSVISHCCCDLSLIAYPAQVDCPWCGCGWLFTCMACRKAFTFARGVEIEESLEQLAARDFGVDAEEDSLADWVTDMSDLLSNVEVGQRYVYLDGRVLRAALGPVAFSGWYASHRFTHLPQVVAEANPSELDSNIGQENYWRANALPE